MAPVGKNLMEIAHDNEIDLEGSSRCTLLGWGGSDGAPVFLLQRLLHMHAICCLAKHPEGGDNPSKRTGFSLSSVLVAFASLHATWSMYLQGRVRAPWRAAHAT